MSDARIREALDRLEAWLADPAWGPEAVELAEWNQEYQSAVDGAERGPGWQELVVRAHALGAQLSVRMASVSREKDAVKTELDSFARGNRALKGYGASAR